MEFCIKDLGINKADNSRVLVIMFSCFSRIKLILLNFIIVIPSRLIIKIFAFLILIHKIKLESWVEYLVSNFYESALFVLFLGAIVLILKNKEILLAMLIIPITASCIVFIIIIQNLMIKSMIMIISKNI